MASPSSSPSSTGRFCLPIVSILQDRRPTTPLYLTPQTKKSFALSVRIFDLRTDYPSHPPLRSRAAGSRRTKRRRMKQRTKETEARFRSRSLPGLLGKNGRQIRTQRGPLTPKPPSFSSEETRLCGFLKCTEVYWPVYNVLRGA